MLIERNCEIRQRTGVCCEIAGRAASAKQAGLRKRGGRDATVFGRRVASALLWRILSWRVGGRMTPRHARLVPISAGECSCPPAIKHSTRPERQPCLHPRWWCDAADDTPSTGGDLENSRSETNRQMKVSPIQFSISHTERNSRHNLKVRPSFVSGSTFRSFATL